MVHRSERALFPLIISVISSIDFLLESGEISSSTDFFITIFSPVPDITPFSFQYFIAFTTSDSRRSSFFAISEVDRVFPVDASISAYM